MAGRPLIIGHRGYPGRYPENTVASFLGALLAGADGVELDVWPTRDGELAVTHGPEVLEDPRAWSPGTLRELRARCLPMAQCVPTLGEALDAIPEGYIVMVEVKHPAAAPRALEEVEKRGRLGDVIFISFSPEALREVRRRSPGARLGFTVDSIEDIQLLWSLHRELNLHLVSAPVYGVPVLGEELYQELLLEARRAGLKTALWPADLPWELQRLGLLSLTDYAITNDPHRWKQWLQAKNHQQENHNENLGHREKEKTSEDPGNAAQRRPEGP